MIRILVNGKERVIETHNCTLDEFMKEEKIVRGLVIVKINGQVVMYEDHKSYVLKLDDNIEIEHVLLAGG